MHIVVDMAPPSMQLHSFPLPSPCTLFWASLVAYFADPLISPLEVS